MSFSFDKFIGELQEKYVARKRVLQHTSTHGLREITRDINPGIPMGRNEMIKQILLREFPPR